VCVCVCRVLALFFIVEREQKVGCDDILSDPGT